MLLGNNYLTFKLSAFHLVTGISIFLLKINKVYSKVKFCKRVCIVSCVVTNEEKTYVNLHRTVPLCTVMSTQLQGSSVRRSSKRKWLSESGLNRLRLSK